MRCDPTRPNVMQPNKTNEAERDREKGRRKRATSDEEAKVRDVYPPVEFQEKHTKSKTQ